MNARHGQSAGPEVSRSGSDIDMGLFARNAGANVSFAAGSVVFSKGDPGMSMYVVQSGVINIEDDDR